MHLKKKLKFIYIFAIILCFLKGKTNKSGFLWHRRDQQYASTNERCIIHYKFIFITPPASIQINLKTLSSICGSTPNIYLILTHWWAPGETQELMTTRMYSSLFRGGGRGESNLSNFYTEFIKKWLLIWYYYVLSWGQLHRHNKCTVTFSTYKLKFFVSNESI